MSAQTSSDTALQQLKELLSQLRSKVKEGWKESSAIDMADLLYVSANTIGGVLAYVLLTTAVDKLVPADNKLARVGGRLAVGAVTALLGGFIRTNYGVDKTVRLFANSMIGGGTLTMVSGVVILLQKK